MLEALGLCGPNVTAPQRLERVQAPLLACGGQGLRLQSPVPALCTLSLFNSYVRIFKQKTQKWASSLMTLCADHPASTVIDNFPFLSSLISYNASHVGALKTG